MVILSRYAKDHISYICLGKVDLTEVHIATYIPYTPRYCPMGRGAEGPNG